MKMRLTALCFVATSFCASAHIVLEQKSATAGSYFKASFQVGHGCDGAATTALRIRIPAGIVSARPQPRPGWQVAVRTEALSVPQEQYGRKLTERISEITWSGGLLADAHFDEFAIQLKLPDQPGPMRFDVLQTCASGQNDWSQVAVPGEPAPHWPAPVLEVTPAAAKPHQH